MSLILLTNTLKCKNYKKISGSFSPHNIFSLPEVNEDDTHVVATLSFGPVDIWRE